MKYLAAAIVLFIGVGADLAACAARSEANAAAPLVAIGHPHPAHVRLCPYVGGH